jgi:hypothetical protein
MPLCPCFDFMVHCNEKARTFSPSKVTSNRLSRLLAGKSRRSSFSPSRASLAPFSVRQWVPLADRILHGGALDVCLQRPCFEWKKVTAMRMRERSRLDFSNDGGQPEAIRGFLSRAREAVKQGLTKKSGLQHHH